MTKTHPVPAARRLTLAAALALFAALLLASTALAAFFNISLSDNSIADWAGAPELHEDGLDTGLDPQNDIVRTYMVRDAALSQYSFRITMGAIGDGETVVTANLDCDNDGDIDGPEDIYVTYFPGSGFGDLVEIGLGDGSGAVSDYPAGGQVVVTGPDVDYEWAGVIAGTPLAASACVQPGNIGVIFSASYNETDTTVLREWNVPTAVELQDFAARPQVAPLTAAALLALAGLLALGSFVIVRRKI